MAFFDAIIRRDPENAYESNVDAESTPDQRRFAQLSLRRRALHRLIREIEEEMAVLQRRIQNDRDHRSWPIENVG
jgi:hypothetical protein